MLNSLGDLGVSREPCIDGRLILRRCPLGAGKEKPPKGPPIRRSKTMPRVALGLLRIVRVALEGAP